MKSQEEGNGSGGGNKAGRSLPVANVGVRQENGRATPYGITRPLPYI